ncbi:MAG: hypothetical protein U0T81_00810 [Saprospiraceae bacterium]
MSVALRGIATLMLILGMHVMVKGQGVPVVTRRCFLVSVVPLVALLCPTGFHCITVPNLLGRWTASPTCSDGTNTWTLVAGTPVQVPPAGSTFMGSSVGCVATNPIPVNIEVDYFRIVAGSIIICSITKGDMFTAIDNTPPTLSLPANVTFDVNNGCSVLQVQFLLKRRMQLLWITVQTMQL